MLKLYNTLSGKKEIFKPKKHKIVEFFVCGPTVYDMTHLGHARTYLAFDMIVKYLREKGHDVFYLQNITDIDDKIINRAKERKLTPEKLARNFEKEYLADMKSLKIDSVTKYARATDHIKEIINQIERLKQKGFAYQIKDGIYYNIKKFKNYGKLSKRTVVQAEDGVSRIDEAKGKRNRGDFCLWKLSKPGEPKWPSPFGWGRPGWHIEDTAIGEKIFGFQYDIHGGGQDLTFPHHEAEIAQMEALSNKAPFVKYWLHTGFLTVNGRKMAKSLGNFITVKDFINRHSARLLRFMVLKAHYRSPIDYNEFAVVQAKRELERIDEFVGKLKRCESCPKAPREAGYRPPGRSHLKLGKFQKQFEAAMEDDFNTPKAMAIIFELINRGNALMAENKLTQTDAKDILQFFKKIDRYFNFIFWPEKKERFSQEIINLVEKREKYRKKNNWRKADEIRKQIQKLGWRVEDTKTGPKLKKIS